MYQIYNPVFCEYRPEKYSSFAEVLMAFYRLTRFDNRHYSFAIFRDERYEIHWYGSKIDHKTHVGEDRATYYMATHKGNWVYDKIHERDLYWVKKENKEMRMEGFQYRCSPVPHVHRLHHGGWLRYPRTRNEMKANSDSEIRQYVRPARRPINLPNAYDDIVRSSSRCWKDNCKSSKQYWKHKKGEAKASPVLVEELYD